MANKYLLTYLTTEMIGMKPKDAIKLDEVPLVTRESYPPEEVLPEDGLYPAKNTMTSDAEQLIGYDLRELID